MSLLSWGKPSMYVKDLDDPKAKWVAVPLAADGSYEFSTEEGDKLEALFEGGETEDVKYKSAKYTAKYDVRIAKGKPNHIPDRDGVVDHHYAYLIVPEDPTCPAGYLAKTAVTVSAAQTTADGWKRTYTHSALKPEGDDAKTFDVGRADVTKAADTGDIAVKFAPMQPDGSYAAQAVDL